MNWLRHKSSGPILADFSNAHGTPIVLNTSLGEAYVLTDDGDIYCIGSNRRTVIATGDGVTTVQTEVADAVALAYVDGAELYWPAGTYLTTATIPNFHDVRHRGPGVVKRGSDLFYVDPSLNPGETNILYVATTGDNANDGLSSSQPRLTAQATGNLLYGYSYGDVTWKITVAAGTYQATTTFSRPFPTPNRVQFLGVAVSDGTTPTTIFDSPGGSGQSGLFFQNYIRAYVEDIKFTDYNDSGTISISGASSGINVDGRSEVWTRNVFASNCDVAIRGDNCSQVRVQAGILSANAIDISAIRDTTFTVGYGGSAADVNGVTGTALLTATQSIFSQEYAMVHADYCYITGTTGLIPVSAGRVHAVSSTFNGCTIGADVRLGGIFANTSCTFTACTDDIIRRSGGILISPSDSTVDQTSMRGPALYEVDTAGASTQSATPVTAYSRDFKAKELQTRGAYFSLKLYGEVVGAANTKTIVVTLGGTTLLTAVIAAATTDYCIEVECITRTAASSQKVFTRIIENGVLPTVALNVSVAEDLTAAKTLTVTHQVTNTADLNRIGWVELEIVH